MLSCTPFRIHHVCDRALLNRIYLAEGTVCSSVLFTVVVAVIESNCCLVPLDRKERVGAHREISGVQVRSWRWRRGHGVTGEALRLLKLMSFCVPQSLGHVSDMLLDTIKG